MHPAKLGLAGHGFGGAAAVFAAAAKPARAKAVAAIFPSVTKPSAEEPATLTMPGLVLATGRRQVAADRRAGGGRDWTGAQLRVVDKSAAAEVAEKRRLLGLVGLSGSNTRTQKTVRAVVTGFLLFHLAGDKTYREFADTEAKLPGTRLPDPDAVPVTDEDRIVALFR